MTPTVGYVRVSTAQQAEEGLSIDAQQEKIRLYAQLHDLELVAVEVDRGRTAKNMDRPGLQSALARLSAGEAQALLVVKLDRLTRSVRDLLRIIEEELGSARLISVHEQIDTTTPGGRLVLTVLGAVAQWEREAIAERTRSVLAHKRALGEWTGGKPPFGYCVLRNKRGIAVLQEDPVEQEIMEIVRDYHSEKWSAPEIARHLNKRSFPTRSGKPWNRQAVHRIVAKLNAEEEK